MNLKLLRKTKTKEKTIEDKMQYVVRKLNEITPLYIQTSTLAAFPSIEIEPSIIKDMFVIKAKSGEFRLMSVIDYTDKDIFDSIRDFCHCWNSLITQKGAV